MRFWVAMGLLFFRDICEQIHHNRLLRQFNSRKNARRGQFAQTVGGTWVYIKRPPHDTGRNWTVGDNDTEYKLHSSSIKRIGDASVFGYNP